MNLAVDILSPQSVDCVTITINGRPVRAVVGQTVLEAAQSAGIDIPTLCHHPALPDYGACRICLVEIEKQRALQPSCTFPVSEGLVIQTESDRVVAARKFVLQMLFSERPHYCMFCSVSGSGHSTDCELQRLAYRYDMDSWLYPPDTGKDWPIDATRSYFTMDHGRCILCRRCVRACNEVMANHTLGVHQRGARTLICADDDLPMGLSSCVSCGACLQVCPTGALIDRRSAFVGHECDMQRIRTTCVSCAVGCSIETLAHDNRVLRVESSWDGPNKGVLCSTGRFETLGESRPRIISPQIRRNGHLESCDWDEALSATVTGIKGSKSVAGLISANTSNETLIAFRHLFRDVFRSTEVAVFQGEAPPLGLGEAATMNDLVSADCIVVISGDPFQDQRTLGYLTRRAVDNGARLVVVGEGNSTAGKLADLVIPLPESEKRMANQPVESLKQLYHIRPDRMAQVKAAVDTARNPVVLYAPGLDSEFYASLRALPVKTRFMPLVKGANMVGATRLGYSVRSVSGDAVYVLAEDTSDLADHEGNGDGRYLMFPDTSFLVVQSAYQSALTQHADVVLPAQAKFEMKGHILNVEGRRLTVSPSVEGPAGVMSDWTTLFLLSVRLGHPLGCMTVSDFATAE